MKDYQTKKLVEDRSMKTKHKLTIDIDAAPLIAKLEEIKKELERICIAVKLMLEARV